ncbi:hypothetical protein FB45DRAFT_298775 [Roridomyces roridus]|uniref:DUF6535 domain-containing protein n=1 Tax=Roridomyces roridus TaxID=1738132 RepID=A0AAD7CCL5_9AGAR|nr:hypothetical protein FB45DRAFT_298775 [Roridomyces roridus]
MPRSTADIEKGKQSQGSETPALADPSEDAAATKLWAVYVSEAEKYDKALVESWKSDMEGMLIFAGLFSASLTAFIIESYPMLLPDSGDTTVQLLAQISQQLAAAANGSTFLLPQRTPAFAPPTASLVCNYFWFVSLGLSLSCALVATLVEQWARDFLHKADMRSAPAMRARIFSYLYYGLKRFSMHVVVDIIPLLLHASLLFFFAGLVAFLIPINIPMAAVAGAILALVTAMYSILTFLPLMYLDCPYRTPLSGAFWDLSRQTRGWFRRRHRVGADTSADKTAMGAMSHQAMHPSPERNARDYQALVWTVKSLADDNELEPFIEAIPDVVCGSQSLRWGYRDHIQNIIHNTDLALLPRLRGLLHSCHSGLLSGAVGQTPSDYVLPSVVGPWRASLPRRAYTCCWSFPNSNITRLQPQNGLIMSTLSPCWCSGRHSYLPKPRFQICCGISPSYELI